jgi:hypothetical protein
MDKANNRLDKLKVEIKQAAKKRFWYSIPADVISDLKNEQIALPQR